MTSCLRRLVLLSLAALAVAITAAPATAQLREFILTEPVHSVDSLPFYIGMRKGFFKDEGFDIKIVTTEGGGRHIAAVLSGDAHAFIGGPEHLAFALVKGGKPMRAVVSMANRANVFFVAGNNVPMDPKAKLADQLRGKRIAASTRGGTGYSLTRWLVAREGLDYQKDVVLVEIANSAGRLAAVRAGQADIAVINEPVLSQGVKAGVWKPPFLGMPQELGPFVYATVNVAQELIEKQPDVVRSIVRGTLKSLDYTFKNPEDVKAIARLEFPTLPPEDIDAILGRIMQDQMWQRDGRTDAAAWKRLHDVVRSTGLLSRDVKFEEIFDLRFVP